MAGKAGRVTRAFTLIPFGNYKISVSGAVYTLGHRRIKGPEAAQVIREFKEARHQERLVDARRIALQAADVEQGRV